MRVGIFCSSLIFLLLSGCAAGTPRPRAEALFFPAAPEEPRLQFLASFSSARDIENKPGGFAQFILGQDNTEKPIIKPYGVTVRGSKIYVCDTVANGVEILDLKDKTFRYFRPDGSGRLIDPINIDITPDGEMVIADARRGQVLIFSSGGSLSAEIGGKDELKPTDVLVSNGRIYVCDLKSHSVRIYDAGTRQYLSSLPAEPVSKEGRLFSPTNIAISPAGNIYVSDLGSFNVKEYSPDGALVKVLGMMGDVPGAFARPKGVAVDRDGRVYVVDAAFNNVQIFDPQGKLLLFFPDANDGVNMVLPAGIAIDYDNVEYFRDLISKDFQVEYLVFVASQYGERKLNVFGFGRKK